MYPVLLWQWLKLSSLPLLTHLIVPKCCRINGIYYPFLQRQWAVLIQTQAASLNSPPSCWLKSIYKRWENYSISLNLKQNKKRQVTEKHACLHTPTRGVVYRWWRAPLGLQVVLAAYSVLRLSRVAGNSGTCPQGSLREGTDVRGYEACWCLDLY